MPVAGFAPLRKGELTEELHQILALPGGPHREVHPTGQVPVVRGDDDPIAEPPAPPLRDQGMHLRLRGELDQREDAGDPRWGAAAARHLLVDLLPERLQRGGARDLESGDLRGRFRGAQDLEGERGVVGSAASGGVDQGDGFGERPLRADPPSRETRRDPVRSVVTQGAEVGEPLQILRGPILLKSSSASWLLEGIGRSPCPFTTTAPSGTPRGTWWSTTTVGTPPRIAPARLPMSTTTSEEGRERSSRARTEAACTFSPFPGERLSARRRGARAPSTRSLRPRAHPRHRRGRSPAARPSPGGAGGPPGPSLRRACRSRLHLPCCECGNAPGARAWTSGSATSRTASRSV